MGIRLGPQRLEAGDHPEFGEARQVGGVDQLGVGDDGAAVAGAVDPGRGLDDVEGGADPAVADGVDVRPGPERVHRGDGLGKFSGVQLAIPCECAQSV
ncbi:hypothetical protein SALBM311S_01649 [Streptomyces alboniger]